MLRWPRPPGRSRPRPRTRRRPLTARAPAVNATGVAAGNNITATFSEAVNGVTRRRSRSGNAAPTTVIAADGDPERDHEPVDPEPERQPGGQHQYTVTLTGGATAIRDTAGAALASTSWSFTTVAPPGAPVIGTALAGVAGGTVTATAAWTPPANNGGSAITGYVVRAQRVNAAGTVLDDDVGRAARHAAQLRDGTPGERCDLPVRRPGGQRHRPGCVLGQLQHGDREVARHHRFPAARPQQRPGRRPSRAVLNLPHERRDRPPAARRRAARRLGARSGHLRRPADPPPMAVQPVAGLGAARRLRRPRPARRQGHRPRPRAVVGRTPGAHRRRRRRRRRPRGPRRRRGPAAAHHAARAAPGSKGAAVSALYPTVSAVYRSLGWEVAGALRHVDLDTAALPRRRPAVRAAGARRAGRPAGARRASTPPSPAAPTACSPAPAVSTTSRVTGWRRRRRAHPRRAGRAHHRRAAVRARPRLRPRGPAHRARPPGHDGRGRPRAGGGARRLGVGRLHRPGARCSTAAPRPPSCRSSGPGRPAPTRGCTAPSTSSAPSRRAAGPRTCAAASPSRCGTTPRRGTPATGGSPSRTARGGWSGAARRPTCGSTSAASPSSTARPPPAARPRMAGLAGGTADPAALDLLACGSRAALLDYF